MVMTMGKMLASILIFAALAGSGRAAAVQDVLEWEPFRSEAGKFEVRMPSKPIRNEQSVVTDYGSIVQQQFIAESPEAVCIIAYLDFPKETVISKGIDRILDDACQGAIQGMGVDESSPRRKISLKGYPGRAMEAAARDGSLKVFGRFFLAGERGYILLYATSPEAPAASASRFFDSFILL